MNVQANRPQEWISSEIARLCNEIAARVCERNNYTARTRKGDGARDRYAELTEEIVQLRQKLEQLKQEKARGNGHA